MTISPSESEVSRRWFDFRLKCCSCTPINKLHQWAFFISVFGTEQSFYRIIDNTCAIIHCCVTVAIRAAKWCFGGTMWMLTGRAPCSMRGSSRVSVLSGELQIIWCLGFSCGHDTRTVLSPCAYLTVRRYLPYSIPSAFCQSAFFFRADNFARRSCRHVIVINCKEALAKNWTVR